MAFCTVCCRFRQRRTCRYTARNAIVLLTTPYSDVASSEKEEEAAPSTPSTGIPFRWATCYRKQNVAYVAYVAAVFGAHVVAVAVESASCADCAATGGGVCATDDAAFACDCDEVIANAASEKGTNDAPRSDASDAVVSSAEDDVVDVEDDGDAGDAGEDATAALDDRDDAAAALDDDHDVAAPDRDVAVTKKLNLFLSIMNQY